VRVAFVPVQPLDRSDLVAGLGEQAGVRQQNVSLEHFVGPVGTPLR
jgi:hypothetical protein